jgi:hypothetical protein
MSALFRVFPSGIIFLSLSLSLRPSISSICFELNVRGVPESSEQVLSTIDL